MKRSLIPLLAVLGCNAPAPPPASGGTDLPGGPCGRGLVVVSSDYQSTNVSLIDVEGQLVSSSLISSGSTSSALSAPLSGDVVAPNARLQGDDIVLIDRFPASVLTWVDIETGDVRAQLDVSTGFAANPRDYLETHDGRAYVTRFETNVAAGAESFDGGGDILVLDPTAPEIIARIDLAPAMNDPAFLPRPSRMTRFDDAVYVLLLGYNSDFTAAAPTSVVRIEDDAIAEVIPLDNLFGCEGLTATETELAITCSGLLAGGMTETPDGSGVAIIDRATGSVTITRAEDLRDQPLGFAAAFTRTGLLVNALGSLTTDTPDTVLHVVDGTHSDVLSSERPFEIGDVRCTSHEACGSCFVTDGDAGALHRLSVEDGSLDRTLALDDGIGLPPRVLGRF